MVQVHRVVGFRGNWLRHSDVRPKGYPDVCGIIPILVFMLQCGICVKVFSREYEQSLVNWELIFYAFRHFSPSI
jgi:hypothetical protein